MREWRGVSVASDDSQLEGRQTLWTGEGAGWTGWLVRDSGAAKTPPITLLLLPLAAPLGSERR